jgi:hypothetical protein
MNVSEKYVDSILSLKSKTDKNVKNVSYYRFIRFTGYYNGEIGKDAESFYVPSYIKLKKVNSGITLKINDKPYYLSLDGRIDINKLNYTVNEQLDVKGILAVIIKDGICQTGIIIQTIKGLK